MAYNPDDVLKELENREYSPVYFLQGEEPYYIDLISSYLEENVLEESEKSFNQIILYGKDAKIAEILTNARRFPMMAERQLVIVKEAQNISDWDKQDSKNILLEYIKNPSPTTILAFCYKYKTLDRRSTLTKELEKSTIFVNSVKIYESQVPSWIEIFLKNKGFTIDHQASQMLTEYIGNNLERLSTEINKMLLNFKEPKEITISDIDRFIGISKEYNVFELQKAIGDLNRLKALQIAKYFAENPKKNPIQIVMAVLYKYFTNLLVLHQSKAHSEKQISSLLRVPFFVGKEYLRALHNFPLEKVKNNIHHLRIADQQSKGIAFSNPGEALILNELIFKLMY